MTSEAFFRIHQDAYFETRNEGPPELAANQKFVACVVEIDITEVRLNRAYSMPIRLTWVSGTKSNCEPKPNRDRPAGFLDLSRKFRLFHCSKIVLTSDRQQTEHQNRINSLEVFA